MVVNPTSFIKFINSDLHILPLLFFTLCGLPSCISLLFVRKQSFRFGRFASIKRCFYNVRIEKWWHGEHKLFLGGWFALYSMLRPAKIKRLFAFQKTLCYCFRSLDYSRAYTLRAKRQYVFVFCKYLRTAQLYCV